MNLKLIDFFDLIDESSEEVVIILEHLQLLEVSLALTSRKKRIANIGLDKEIVTKSLNIIIGCKKIAT